MTLILVSPDFLEVFHKPHDKHMHLFSCFSFLAAVNQPQISATARTVFCGGRGGEGTDVMVTLKDVTITTLCSCIW